MCSGGLSWFWDTLDMDRSVRRFGIVTHVGTRSIWSRFFSSSGIISETWPSQRVVGEGGGVIEALRGGDRWTDQEGGRDGDVVWAGWRCGVACGHLQRAVEFAPSRSELAVCREWLL